MRRVLFYLFVIPLVSGEVLVSVNLKHSVNDISDKFISSEIDFHKLMQMQKNFSTLTPSYLRITNFIDFLRKEENKVRASDITTVFQSLHRNRITPVIVLEYDVTRFDPVALLEDLKRAKSVGVRECVWQLGDSSLKLTTDDDKRSLQTYADDLKTLKLLCESVKRDRRLDWNVAAVGALLESADSKVTFDVEGFDIGRHTAAEMLARAPLKTNQQIWASLAAGVETTKGCDESCLIDGLTHASVLGEAASSKGIDVIFVDAQHSNAFHLAINTLHNALVGTKAFGVRSLPKTSQSSVFAYCSRKMSGGVTLMGVNFESTRVKLSVKLPAMTESSGGVVSQYLLSVGDGQVLLNNEKFNGSVTAAYKFKKHSKHALDFSIPPRSIAFWVLKNVHAKECRAESEAKKTSDVSSSSSDDLLKQLAASRMRRQINLPKFDFKFPSLMSSKLNQQRSISDVFLSGNTEIYKVAPIEQNPLQSSENPALPDGDIYLLVNDGASNDYVDDAEVEFPVERKKSKSQKSPRRHSSSKDMVWEASEPTSFVEKPAKKASAATQAPRGEVGELFEGELPVAGADFDQSSAHSNNRNVEIKAVMRELEPTHRQSKKALLAARRKFDQRQLMELLKDATLQEVDRAHIPNGDEYEVIDLTQNDDEDYEEYDNDEDGFFKTGGDRTRVRTRRSALNDNQRKNEIPRIGEHVYESSEEEDNEDEEDNEALVRFYIQRQHETPTTTTPRHELHSLKPVTVNENSPVVVRVVDAFSKSLDDVIYTVHKNIISWWYLFTSPQAYYS